MNSNNFSYAEEVFILIRSQFLYTFSDLFLIITKLNYLFILKSAVNCLLKTFCTVFPIFKFSDVYYTSV